MASRVWRRVFLSCLAWARVLFFVPLCLIIAAYFPHRIRDTHTHSSVFTSLMVLASMIHQSFLSPLTSYVSASASSVEFLHMLPLLYYHALSIYAVRGLI